MVKKIKKLFIEAAIIPILLANNMIIIIKLSNRDRIFWLVYIIIGNLDIKIH